jgi:hypothetical protein
MGLKRPKMRAVHGLVSMKIVCHLYPVTSIDVLAEMLADTVLSGMLQVKMRSNGR